MKNHSTIVRMEYDHCNGDHQYNPDHYLELLTRRISRDFKDTINTHKCLISIDSIGVCAKCVP
jgi:hypothetical protein